MFPFPPESAADSLRVPIEILRMWDSRHRLIHWKSWSHCFCCSSLQRMISNRLFWSSMPEKLGFERTVLFCWGGNWTITSSLNAFTSKMENDARFYFWLGPYWIRPDRRRCVCNTKRSLESSTKDEMLPLANYLSASCHSLVLVKY